MSSTFNFHLGNEHLLIKRLSLSPPNHKSIIKMCYKLALVVSALASRSFPPFDPFDHSALDQNFTSKSIHTSQVA